MRRNRERGGTGDSDSIRNRWLSGALVSGMALTAIGMTGHSVIADVPQQAAVPARSTVDDAYQELTIFAHFGWFFSIRPDGGGVYGFGDGGPPFSVAIPRATFRFRDTLAQALAVSEKREPTGSRAAVQRKGGGEWYSIALSRRGSSLAEMRDTADVKFGKEIAGKAIAASPPGPELAEVLRTRPPFSSGIAPSPTTTSARQPTTREAVGNGPAELVTLESIPDAATIRDVKLSRTPRISQGPPLTTGAFVTLMKTATPLSVTDPTVRDWSYAPWYSGSFVSRDGAYSFQLYLSGRGLLVTPSGKRGLFRFEAIVNADPK